MQPEEMHVFTRETRYDFFRERATFSLVSSGSVPTTAGVASDAASILGSSSGTLGTAVGQPVGEHGHGKQQELLLKKTTKKIEGGGGEKQREKCIRKKCFNKYFQFLVQMRMASKEK